MAVVSTWNKIYRTLASVRTGIILLLVTVLFSAVGTVILQRPTTDIEEIQRSYSPTTLMWLERLGLTDIYHSWYFLTLLGLVSLSIIFVSIDRWPNAWRFYARPYRRTEPHFRASLPLKATIPVADAATALEATERAFRKHGMPVERIVDNEEVSIYSEKHRFSVFAVYVVHASLLLIFMGGIIDGLVGYRGFMQVLKGESANKITLRGTDGSSKPRDIPFSVRCDNVGMETYENGAPKKYWSDLVIVDNGREARKKHIIVNDPLTYRGVKLYQASMGESGKMDKVELIAAKGLEDLNGKRIWVGLNETVAIDDTYSVRVLRFIPEYYVQDGEVFQKSENLVDPAFQLALVDRSGTETKMWLIPRKANVTMEETPYRFAASDLKMAKYTGLEVSYQPGEWAVWAGVVLMALGLGIVFYMVHMRLWAVVVQDPANGQVLWIGAACNRNRDKFEQKFKAIVEEIGKEVGTSADGKKSERELAHV